MSLRKILDPREPRSTPDPLRHRGTGRQSSCIFCGGRFTIVGRVREGDLLTCPHCKQEQLAEQ